MMMAKEHDTENGCDKCCNVIFLAPAVLTFLASALVVAANVWMCVQIGGHVDSLTGVMSIIVRMYNIMLCLLVILSLFNLKLIFKNAYFLLTYFGSGMFQVFVGVLTLGAADQYAMLNSSVSSSTGINAKNVDLMRSISGWILVGVGMLYIILGICQVPHSASRSHFILKSQERLPHPGVPHSDTMA